MGKGNESKYCVICGKRFYTKHIKFYQVPQSEARRQRWMDTCGLLLNPNSFVCEKHFTAADFNYFNNNRRLIPGAVPLRVDTPETNSIEDVSIFQPQSIMVECGVQTEDDIGCSYRLKMCTLRKEIEVLKAKNEKLLEENNKLKASLSSIFTEEQGLLSGS